MWEGCVSPMVWSGFDVAIILNSSSADMHDDEVSPMIDTLLGPCYLCRDKVAESRAFVSPT